MIDYSKELVAALSSILPVHYELKLTSGTKTPCISYQERNNAVDTNGDTLGYSKIRFRLLPSVAWVRIGSMHTKINDEN